MIHVLFLTEDTSRQLNKNFYYLEQELRNIVNLTIWRKPGHINYILKQLPTRPDFILLLNDIDHQMSPMIKGLAHTDIPTGLFVNDVHRFTNLRRNYIKKNKISHVFTVVRDKFLETYPEFENKMEWFPHFVNTELYKDYELKKSNNLLMMGAVNDYYPLRQKILSFYKGDDNFVYHNHPGYRDFSEKEESENFIGHAYAKEINRAKLFFTCPSVLHYPVIKYFEVLACRTLLLAPTFCELEDLGFIPGIHFVPIDESNFKKQAAYFLENEKERQQIVDQGYNFIRQRHSVKQRTEKLVKRIETIIHK
ncbi:glycosyltransferase involved in cell wall biosynthesis [Virgibacillus natechei]|uniref:Glycosyltransferase involved in cell wall biosynthesis n=1 Tax=Virgibacillus natechei TaxID=1216297 RepID=A0ABS4IC01_9BACI|nr:glycosyltransferase [Virgibacillus natechei]MBP1968455.1 glycosyltransferase involved in cell wall biosynthesis [Virgibacillus natechei]UZD13576.1 glycosyltransferase [Virgibacillus natechei]